MSWTTTSGVSKFGVQPVVLASPAIGPMTEEDRTMTASAPAPTAARELAGRPAHELAALVAAREVSAREVVADHLARIAEVDRALNAVVVHRDAAALREADEADAALRRGDAVGPLHGVPVTCKESFDLAGTPSTAGLPGRAGRRAAVDDPYVARLRAAGAVVVGKTNVAQLLIAYESVNPLHGRTRNPWRFDRTPGGSSGGEAAVVAAGGSALGLGSDILGSIRVPAAFTGLAGFLPTAGRTPDVQRGSIPAGQRAIVSQVGPIAGTVADLRLALDVLAGSGPPSGEPRPELVGPADLSGVGIATWTSAAAGGDAVVTASPAVERAVRTAAAALGDAGTSTRDWVPPDVPHALGLVFGIMGADAGRGLRRLVGRDPIAAEIRTFYRGIAAGRVSGALARAVLPRLGQQTALPTVAQAGRHHVDDYWRLVEDALAYRRRVAVELDAAGVDLVVAPAHAAPALPHGTGAYSGPGGLFSMLVNLLGYPAGVVPVTAVQPGEEGGRPPTRDRGLAALAAADEGSAGLPVGVQVIGRPGHDRLVLAALAAIESATRSALPPRSDQEIPW